MAPFHPSKLPPDSPGGFIPEQVELLMKHVLTFAAAILLVLAACSPAATPTPTSAPPTEAPPTKDAGAAETETAPADEATETAEDTQTEEAALATEAATAAVAAATAESTAQAVDGEPLRIGMLPVINALPLSVAQAEGFYQDEGVNVELVQFGSAIERETALQAGAIHGENTDLQNVILLINGGFEVRAVRFDPPATPYFSIIAGPDTDIETVEDLAGVEIAVGFNTIIEYLTWVLLRDAGLEEDEIAMIEVSSLPQRLEFLVSGQVQAATLPEPLTSLAVAQGARVIINDENAPVVPTVLAFSLETLEERPEDVRAFLRAHERAVEALNENPDEYRELMIERANIPQPLRDSYEIPPYLPAGVMTEEQVKSVMDWMVMREYIEEPLEYDRVVNGDYLP